MDKSAFGLGRAASTVFKGTMAPALSSATGALRNWVSGVARPVVQQGAAALGRTAARHARTAQQGLTHGLQSAAGKARTLPTHVRHAAGLSSSEPLIPGLLRYTAGVPQGQRYGANPIRNTARMMWSPRYLGLDRPVGAITSNRVADKARAAIGAGIRRAGKLSTGLSLPVGLYSVAQQAPEQMAYGVGHSFGIPHGTTPHWRPNGYPGKSEPEADYISSIRNKWLWPTLPKALWHQVAPNSSITPLDRVHRDAVRSAAWPYIRRQAHADNPIIRVADTIRQVTPLGFAMTSLKKQIASATEPDYEKAFNQATKKHLPDLLAYPEQIPQSPWYDFYKTLIPEDMYNNTLGNQVRRETGSAMRKALPWDFSQSPLPEISSEPATAAIPKPSDVLEQLPEPVRGLLPGSSFGQKVLAAAGDLTRGSVVAGEKSLRNQYEKLRQVTNLPDKVRRAVPPWIAQVVRQPIYNPDFWTDNRDIIRGLSPETVAGKIDEVLPTDEIKRNRWIDGVVRNGSAGLGYPAASSIRNTEWILPLLERLRSEANVAPYSIMTRAEMEQAGWGSNPEMPRDQLNLVWNPAEIGSSPYYASDSSSALKAVR